MTLAPIILFVYNRPEHTSKTLEALNKNELADRSTLYIFADGPKKSADSDELERIARVRRIIRSKEWCKEVIISESHKNNGLAQSIITGISSIFEEYDKAIILEDDLVTNKKFLKFMNLGLEKYESIKRVMQISGFSFFESNDISSSSSYFLPITTTWGWATWKRSWLSIDLECLNYSRVKTDSKLKNKFNLDGAYPYSSMLLKQMESNKISSWGIRFYWEVFNHQGIVLYPSRSLVANIGWDGSGEHGDSHVLYDINNINHEHISFEDFPSDVIVDEVAFDEVKSIVRRRNSLLFKIGVKIRSQLKTFKSKYVE